MYNKTNWKDRVVEFPNRYKDQDNTVHTLTGDFGVVTEIGTDVTSAELNKIETGVKDLDQSLYYGKYSQMSGGDEIVGTNASTITFSETDLNECNAINLATYPKRLTIPAGVTRVRFHVFASFSRSYTLVQEAHIVLYKNGLSANLRAATGSFTEFLILDVAAGDYFELYASTYDDGDGQSQVDAGTIFGMTILK